MRAEEIIRLLRTRHAEDLFVPECKAGPSQSAAFIKLDALAIPRSWAKPEITGYEVKVSRGDFLRDDKWKQYLNVCNSFYFVAPAGVINPDELPPEAGLLLASPTSSRLITKKKSPSRTLDLQKLERLFRYILICRARIDGERLEDPRAQLENFLVCKKEKAELGGNLGRTLKKRLITEKEKVLAENQELKNKHQQYAEIRAMMERLKIDKDWSPVHRLQQLVMNKDPLVSEYTIQEIRKAANNLLNIAQQFETANTKV